MSNQASIAKNLLFRSPERVQERHKRILELYALGKSLIECARAVGLSDHTSAKHHVEGKCRCGK